MKKVLIAGATGYLGRFVVRELKNQGFLTKVLVRNKQQAIAEGPFDAPAIAAYTDEIVEAEIIDPSTLIDICKDVDCVFTSIGITRQKDKVTFKDVDFQGNLNLLQEAEKHRVKKFMYIHVLTDDKGEELGPLIEAKSRFVETLTKSFIPHIIFKPSGYFSDVSELFQMAQNGRIFLFGKGTNKLNPIHGSDLASFCVQSFRENNKTLDIGGPDIYTYRQIAELAFEVLNKKERVWHIPKILSAQSLFLLKYVNKHYYGLAKFMINGMSKDSVGPAFGTYHLKDYFDNSR